MVNSVNPFQALQAAVPDARDAAIAPAHDSAAAGPLVDPAYKARVTKAAIDFESFFISNMLQQMRETTRGIASDDSPFKDKVNQDMQDVADKLLAGNIAHQRAFGIADAILRQMLPASPAPLKKDA